MAHLNGLVEDLRAYLENPLAKEEDDQSFKTHRIHNQDHQWSIPPFNFISANICPVDSTDTHLQRICTFPSCTASLLVHSLNPLHKIKLDSSNTFG